MLCTELEAQLDRQAKVVNRLLTTLGDDRRAVAKLFLVQKLGGLQKNYAYFGDIRVSYLFDKYSLGSGGFVFRPEALDPGEVRPRTLCISAKFRAVPTVNVYRHTDKRRRDTRSVLYAYRCGSGQRNNKILPVFGCFAVAPNYGLCPKNPLRQLLRFQNTSEAFLKHWKV